MLVIDSDNYAAAGITPMFFPGGEPHVKLAHEIDEPVLFFAKLRTWNDVGIAACVLNILGKPSNYHNKLDLFVPYFPGARQDKPSNVAPYTVGMVGALLDHYAHCVSVFDPHSRAVWDTINNSGFRSFDFTDLAVPLEQNVEGIIAPDAGAVDRATKFRDEFYPGVTLVKCTKKRDPQTGALSDYEFPLDQVMFSGRYLVVDDICDGGGTFNLLADAFGKRMRCSASLSLYVSHGIFSKGLNAISPRYERIVTTDSWYRVGRDYDDSIGPRSAWLDVLPLSQLFERITKE